MTFNWCVNCQTNKWIQFQYNNIAGVSPTLTWSQLQGLGVTTPGTYTVGVEATDTGNGWQKRLLLTPQQNQVGRP